MNVLITGADGFIGRALRPALEQAGAGVVAAVRRPGVPGTLAVGDIGPATDWRAALAGVDAVVHLAARVHMLRDPAADPLAQYRAVNTAGTLNLARQAAAAGVRRFVYISSIKVNGEGRAAPYRDDDPADPRDPYAVSKWEAERGLAAIARDSGLEVVVLRPPLVYGPGVKANFRSLLRLVERGWPLPLACIDNRRSLVYLGNLVDAIRVCLGHPDAAGRTFLIDDGEPVSTPRLVAALAGAMETSPCLLPLPTGILRLAARLLGRRAAIERLTGSLAVDSSALRAALDWTPPYRFEQGIAATVAAYRAETRRVA